jgi:peptidoglycan/LPS O-acetylase OafA/YrhL
MKHESANLDLLRTIAVSLVVICHLVLALNGGNSDSYDLRALGHAGVALFFVHTTLVLLQSLQRTGGAALPFYVRRVFRLYPLSITIVLFFALLKWLAGSHDTAQVWANLLLVMNITGHQPIPAPLWSLPYEVQMYMVLPLLYVAATKRRSLLWAVALFAASVLVALSLPSDSLAFRLLRFVPCFLPGVLAFVLLRRVRPFLSAWVLPAVVVCWAVLCVPLLVSAGASEVHLLWSVSLLAGLTIPLCRPMPQGRIARACALVALYSYGIYLTHDFAIWPLNGLVPGLPWFAQWGSFLVLLVGLPYIVYHGIEKRGIRLGVHLAQRLSSPRQVQTKTTGRALELATGGPPTSPVESK